MRLVELDRWHRTSLDDMHVVHWLGITQARNLRHLDLHLLRRRRNVHVSIVDHHVLLKASGHSQRNVRRTGQANWRAAIRHSVLRNIPPGDELRRRSRWFTDGLSDRLFRMSRRAGAPIAGLNDIASL